MDEHSPEIVPVNSPALDPDPDQEPQSSERSRYSISSAPPISMLLLMHDVSTSFVLAQGYPYPFVLVYLAKLD
jgi:hypothetical protein